MFATIHRKNAIVLTAVAIVAIPLGVATLSSVLLGGAIQVLNVRLLEKSVGRIVSTAAAGSAVGTGFVHLRLLGLLTLVGYVLLFVPIDVIGFSLGLSTAVPAALWHGLATAQEAR